MMSKPRTSSSSTGGLPLAAECSDGRLEADSRRVEEACARIEEYVRALQERDALLERPRADHEVMRAPVGGTI